MHTNGKKNIHFHPSPGVDYQNNEIFSPRETFRALTPQPRVKLSPPCKSSNKRTQCRMKIKI